ncbi:MAG: hypothetical protein AAF902_10100 [Chloroflexota bacterium]
MKPKDAIFISLTVNEAYEAGISVNQIKLKLTEVKGPFLDEELIPVWMTEEEAAYYRQIIDSGAEFWDNEYDDLNFTYVSQKLFNDWRLSTL